ncbi:histone acetyltransferase subunit NuA4-domain-containing protein [Thermothelomyces heterothallicus CBS 202.75]|uniref:histone acetyltransferase subunit NuA4-domain-containing protein n=1 Tax=Thermothelomyces heterothallicus CBS 202.75 TaxID=1149848 RepID=UPI00374379D2
MAESTAAAAANAPKAAAGPNGTTATAAATDTAASSSSAGIPFYESQRKQLRELISRRRALEKKLAAIEEHIAVKEANYLESTPAGNIIIGFDNYVKGGNAAAAQRRKTGLTDQNKVFSRSSVSYNPAAAAAAAAADAQTPASTPAPTPMSSSFGNGNGPSGAPTPTSAAGGGRANAPKKSKRNTPAAAAGAEDSETDGREAKKVRTSFGARK